MTDQSQDTFAARLLAARQKAKLSRYRVAQLSGLTAQTVANLEAGTNAPSLDSAVRLATALGVPLAYLAGDVQEKGDQGSR